MALISVFGFLIFIILGYNSPRKLGWAMVILVPLLSPAQFTLVPSINLPLTMHRIAFAVSIGMLLKNPNSLSILKGFLKSKVYFVILVFLITYGISAMREEPINTIFAYIPNMIYPILIAGLLIRNKLDLIKLTKILSIQAAIICIFIFIEFFFDFNISVLLKKTNPNINIDSLWEGASVHFRSGYFRMSGIDGHPVYTGYRLAFLFPILLWYVTKNKLTGIVFLILCAVSLLFLQARAAIIVVIFSFGLINIVSLKSLFKYLFIGAMLIFMMFQIPFIKNFSSNFYNSSFSEVTEGLENKSMAERFIRIPAALNKFLEKPLTGYGSKKTVLYKVMPEQSNDLPAPIMYLVAGGIVVGLSYFLIFLGMILSVIKIRRAKDLSESEKELLKFITVALIAGFMVLCANTAEAHKIIMLMLFSAVYKTYVITPKLKLQVNAQ